MRKLTLLGALSAALLITGCMTNQLVTRSLADPLPGAQRLLSPAPHNFRQVISIDGAPTRRGNSSQRFELRHGDCGGSDCGNPRSRAEIEMTEGLGADAIGQGIWYGWSFYNQSVPRFTKENSLRLVFGQWTKGGTGKPIVRFIQLGKGEGNFAGCDASICDTKNNTSGDLVVQLEDIATQKNWGDAQNNGYVCRIMDLETVKGRWVDMTMHTNFSAGADGYLKIWVDGNLMCDYAGPLVSAQTLSDPREIKRRHGIYASWTKRWAKAEGGAAHPNLIVFYDEFRSGPRKNDVDVRYRAGQLDRPVD